MIKYMEVEILGLMKIIQEDVYRIKFMANTIIKYKEIYGNMNNKYKRKINIILFYGRVNNYYKILLMKRNASNISYNINNNQ